MPFAHLAFPSMPWASGTHPLERKKSSPDGGATLLEFAPGFADPNWCERGHVLYVLEGSLGLELEGGEVTVAAGECAVLDPGTRHRAKSVGPARALVFVVGPPRP